MYKSIHHNPTPHQTASSSHHTPIAVPVEQGVNWEEQAIIMGRQLAEVPTEHYTMTIFRLPTCYHETNKHLYEPKMVAIGPYHRHKGGLKAMEEHKWLSLKNICGEIHLRAYIAAVRALEQRARRCYSEYVQMESADFVRMLLLDGCFIIDYFEKMNKGNVDPICNVGWAKIHLYTDLFLLENQIPFFVIHDLFALRYDDHNCQNPGPLLELFCRPLKKIFSTTELIKPNISCQQIHHLLQLYYLCMVPMENHIIPMERDIGNGESLSRWQRVFHRLERGNDASVHYTNKGNNISCVSELHEASITFKKKENSRDMFDITFKNGIMEMPFLKVEDTHKVILWNMAAFEQSQLHIYKLQILSSYLALMDSLINTEKDVTILERAGVIENYLQSNEDAAALFNQFAKSFVLDYTDHYYKELFQEVKRHSKSTWHKNRARLKHDYFSNPWTTISVLAAALLLLLTAAQTYYSSKSAK